jgi:hypothetical protein
MLVAAYAAVIFLIINVFVLAGLYKEVKCSLLILTRNLPMFNIFSQQS